jgi:hypothetical protein
MTRMILIDSYSKGRVVELEVAGGAALAGRNGEGKTTLLSVLPLFHGETPSRLVRKGANRQGFVRHYLPHTSSYIVFEYVREDGDLCMSVFYANADGTSVNQRFVRAPFNATIFISEDGASFLPTRELKARLSERRISSSNVNDLAACRNVLHGTPQNREQAQDVQLYSVTPPGKPIPGVERIISGMFQRTTNFSDIAAIVVRNVQDGEDPIQLKTKRDQVEWWVRDYDAYTGVMRAEPRWRAAESAAIDVLEARGHLGRIVSSLDGFLQHILAERAELDDQDRSISSSETRIQDEDRPRLQNLRTTQASLTTERKQIIRDEDQYQSALERHLSADLEKAAEDLETLPNLDRSITDLSRRKDVLEGEAGSISTRYDRLMVDARDRSAEQAAALHTEMTPRRAAIDESRAASERRATTARGEHQASVTRDEEEMDGRVADATRRHAAAKERVRHPVVPQDIMKARDGASTSHIAARRKHDDARAALAEGQAAVQEAKNNLQAAEQNVGHARSRQTTSAAALEEARAVVQGPEGSMLRFARENLPSALGGLTRSMPIALLLRNDLSPTLSEGDADSAFGIRFDISRLPEDAASDIENARGHLEKTEAEKIRATSVLQDAVKALDRTGTALFKASQELRPLQLAESSLQTRLEEEAALERNVVLAYEEARASAATHAQRHLSSAENDLKQVLDTRSAMRSAHADQTARLDREYAEYMADLRSQVATLEESFVASQTELRDSLALSIASLTQERNDALRRHGVDVDAVQRIVDETKSLSLERERIASREKEVSAWRHWNVIEPPRHETRLSRLAEIDRDIKMATKDGDALELRIQRESAELRERRNAISKRRETIVSDEMSVSERLKTLEPFRDQSPTQWRSQDVLGLTLKDAAAAHSRIVDSEKRRDFALRDLDAAFNAHRDSAPFSYLHEGSFETDGGGERLAGFRAWYETRHGEIKLRISDTAETLSRNIGVFRDGMHEFRRSLLSFNRDIQKHLADIAVFESLTSLEIDIRPSFDKLEYWPRIEAVAETARAMAAKTERGALPDAEFRDAVASLLPLWNSGTAIRADLASLIHISGKVCDKGVVKTFQSGMELGDISSNGLSYLILASILTAFVDRIRKGSSTTIVWAVDELRDLDAINAAALVSMLKARRIEIVSAFTDVDSGIMRHFANRYAMRTGRRIQRVLLQDRRSRGVQDPGRSTHDQNQEHPNVL